MKPPTIKCDTCGEYIFGRKKPGNCQQCWIKANAHRKFQRLTSACNWRNGIAPILPALDRKPKKRCLSKKPWAKK